MVKKMTKPKAIKKPKTPRATYFKRLMKWVDALESGEYPQAKGSLINTETGGLCCLGVACDVSGLGKWSENGFYLKEASVLPKKVMDYFGLEGRCGFTVEKGSYRNSDLTDLNDGVGLSFKQIAKYVRKWAKDTYSPKKKF